MSDFYYDDAERDEQNKEGIYGDEEDYGSCPICGSAGEMIDQGRRHWMVCHADRVKWRIGSGLFGFLQRERGAKWQRADDWLANYREVQADKTPPPSAETDADLERFKRLFE